MFLDDIDIIIAGAIRTAIHAHGPITKEWIGSATKRIAQQLRGSLIAKARDLQKAAFDAAVDKIKKENGDLRNRNQRLENVIRDLMGLKD